MGRAAVGNALWAVLTSRDRYARDRFSLWMPAQADGFFDGMWVSRKLSILASTDEMPIHSLSNSAICVRMLTAFVAISRSRPASDSPVHSIRRLLLVSIACDQTRDSD
jgi:hypothetical protein